MRKSRSRPRNSRIPSIFKITPTTLKIIDTHCHLISKAFTSDVEACILRAQEVGVTKMLLACCDEKEFPLILELCSRHPGVLFPSIGIHPEDMADDIDAQLATTKRLLDAYCCPTDGIPTRKLPIGEIGFDLYWDKTRFADQQRILQVQFDWALAYDLPVLLHIRDAMQEFLDFLRLYLLNKYKENSDTAKVQRLRGILHCYSGDARQAREAMELGDFFIGIGGTLTYKNSKVPDVVKAIGIDRIVLETDSPYLSPIPYRGRRNEPSYTVETARFLAELLDLPLEEVAKKTSENAEKLLGI